MAATDERIIYSNPMATIQVLGALASNPLLLGDEKYRFSVNDFPADFYKYVFKAIVGIALQSDDGEIDIARIDPIDVERWLKNYPEWYLVFSSNDGANWLRKAIDAYDPGKFHYYYNLLKKYSLLNAMLRSGIDTRPILDPTLVDPVEIMKRQEAFDAMSIKDIIATVETSVIDFKEKYDSSDSVLEAGAGASIWDTLESVRESPEIGAGFTSGLLTQTYRGMRLGTVVVESAPQGVGKSRRQAAESAHLAIPEYYDLDSHTWKRTGYNLPVVLISSELILKEVQFMWLAYISGVPEERIVVNTMTREENERVQHAAKLLEESQLYFVEISNYDITDIETIIKKYVLTKKVTHVFFDYVGTTQKIMSASSRATKIKDLREDQILLMFMERLKNLAKILNIAIYTATQITGNWKEVKEADQQMIRGAKAIADKPDGGWVLLPVRESDRMIVEQYKEKGFVEEPTHVMHIYKNRGNPLVNIRIYGKFIRNVCRWTDCFVTDFQGHIQNVVPLEVTWNEPDPQPEEKPEETAVPAKKKIARQIDVGELPSIREDELPFDFSEPKSTSWGGDSSALAYVDVNGEVKMPYDATDMEIPEEQPVDEPADDKPEEQSWGGNPFDGLDF